MNKKLLTAIIVTSILTFLALDDIIVDWSQIDGSFGKLYIFFTQDLFPPDWSILSAEPGIKCSSEFGFFCSQAWKGISETIKMAFIATVLEQFSILGIDNIIVPISAAFCFNFFITGT